MSTGLRLRKFRDGSSVRCEGVADFGGGVVCFGAGESCFGAGDGAGVGRIGVADNDAPIIGAAAEVTFKVEAA